MEPMAEKDESDRVRNRINDAIESKILRSSTTPISDQPAIPENVLHELPGNEEPNTPTLGGASRETHQEPMTDFT